MMPSSIKSICRVGHHHDIEVEDDVTAILEYAHTYGVPYFKDTTPKWSTRGKLRNELQPLLRDVYGEGVGAHLTTLAKDSAQCAALVEAHMLRPFWKAVGRSRCAVHVDCAPYAACTAPGNNTPELVPGTTAWLLLLVLLCLHVVWCKQMVSEALRVLYPTSSPKQA